MEVHHHSNTSRKKWTHYFWEFLMLFLAVFCGFFAEYQLEHKIEKERAKQYIYSFYEDLKADTAKLDFILNYDGEKISGLTDMMACHEEVLKNPETTSCLGILVKHSKTTRTFEVTDRTLRQLANAGGFRLLNSSDADSILNYETRYRQYKNFESTIFQTAQDNVRNTLNELADFRINAPLQNFAPYGIDTISGQLNGPLMYADNKTLMNKWFNELALYLRVIRGQSYLLNGLRSHAISLLQYYKLKYHFE